MSMSATRITKTKDARIELLDLNKLHHYEMLEVASRSRIQDPIGELELDELLRAIGLNTSDNE